jgi:hypothetical protein
MGKQTKTYIQHGFSQRREKFPEEQFRKSMLVMHVFGVI